MAKGQLRIRILGDDRHLRKKLSGATKLLGGFAAAGVAAVAGLAAFSIREFANFDDAMTKSLAIMGDVSDKMRGEMSDAAREVGRTTKFSAEEAAESYFFLASAGMDAAQSIEALPKVAAFAQAGNFDMARATDLATDAQSALAMTSDDAAENVAELTRVTDVFVKANTLANASVEQFSESMTGKGGAAVQAWGKDIEEGTAILAVFADQGLKGTEAGTILARTLDGLGDQARKNKDAFEDLGVAVFDSDGEMRNIAAIIGDLEGALEGMSTEQRNAELAQLGFNERAARGIEMLLGNSDALRDYERDLRDAAGTTDEVANKQMESFNAKMGLIWDQIKDVALSIGEALMPALDGFADWLSANLPSITSWFSDVSEKFTDLLGTGKESTDGLTHELGMLDRKAAAIKASYIGSLGEMEAQTLHHLTAAGMDISDFQEKAGTEFDTVGGFMQKLWEAWKAVWDEDVKPWLLNTAVPWIENVFAPALMRAMSRAGSAAVDAALAGMRERLSLSRMGRQVLDNFQGKFLNVLRDNPEYHSGGIVQGRRGQEVVATLMAGETVLPTHDRQAMARLLADSEDQASQQLSGLAGSMRGSGSAVMFTGQSDSGHTDELLEQLIDATRDTARRTTPLVGSLTLGSKDDWPNARKNLRKIQNGVTYGGH